ncbi:MAG TPA: serine protease [Saprospiraceae bacterium]|nr:serine protease [Saprospiraceae bacterium]HPI06605.1 serine protease [Saprospiraceae bacterium]
MNFFVPKILGVLFFCSLLGSATLNAQHLNDKEELRPCEEKYFATLTFYQVLKRYAAMEGIHRSQRSLNEEKAFIKKILPIPGTHHPQPDPPLPHALPPGPFHGIPGGISDLDSISIYNIPDALGTLAISYLIMNDIHEEACLPNNSSEPAQWGTKLKIWKSILDNYAIYQGNADAGHIVDNRSEFSTILEVIGMHFDKSELDKAKQYNKLCENRKTLVMVIELSELDIHYSKTEVLIKASRLESQQIDQTSLCPDMPFGKQMATYCRGTGFFIKTGVIATAAHLFEPETAQCDKRDISNYCFISGVELPLKTVAEGIVIPKKNIYVPANPFISAGNCFQGIDDWALIKVKPYKSKCKLPKVDMTYTENPNNNMRVYSFGHGLGLPLKFCFDSPIWLSSDAATPNYIWSRLDLFGGNSGSPVFDSRTGNLIGILTGGADDFDLDAKQNCLRCALYQDNFPASELIQGIKPVVQALTGKKGAQKQSTQTATPGFTPKSTQGKTAASAERDHKTRYYAPYCYLRKSVSDNVYTLGILVPFAKQSKPMRLVSADTSNKQNPIIIYAVDTTASSGDSFDSRMWNFRELKENTQITVRVIRGAEFYTTTLYCNRADTADLDVRNALCMNVPYSYLEKKKADTLLFVPHLLVPTSTDSMPGEVVKTVGVAGFQTEITIIGYTPNGAIKIYEPPLTNNAVYVDNSNNHTSGYFESNVTTKKPGKGGRRKTDHPNASVNGKPRKKHRK